VNQWSLMVRPPLVIRMRTEISAETIEKGRVDLKLSEMPGPVQYADPLNSLFW